MSRESKILDGKAWGVEKTIHHYESFGWELLSLNGNQITMTRETQNPVYADLVKYQAKYEELVCAYRTVRYPEPPEKPTEFKFGLCLFLLVLAVVPGALYIAYKVKKKKEFEEAVKAHVAAKAECDKKKSDILAEIEKTLNDSRATFFGKQ